MKDVSLSDLLNVPETIEFEGKSYSLREITLEQRARFGRWLKDRALAAITGGDAPEHVRSAALTVFVATCATAYEFDSPAGLAALQTLDGQAKVVQLCLEKDHPDIEFEECRRLVTAEWERLAGLITEKLADPKCSAAMAEALGSPTSPQSSRTSRSRARSKKSKGSRPRK